MYIPIDINYSVKKECRRRRYSEKTIKTYLYWITTFLKTCGDKELGKISKQDVRLFLEKLSNRELSGNTMNTAHMAIKFLFEDVMRKKMWIDIKYSKIPKRIQRVLSKEEVKRLLNSIKNHKHKVMIALLYSSGMRVSELTNIKIRDLEIKKGYGFIRQGKGGKDRIFVISEKLRMILAQLIIQRKKENFLFCTRLGGKYHVKTIQKIIKVAAKNAKLKDAYEVHPHTLRHSFATHLIENSYCVSDVQAMLGHKSPEMSLHYIHTGGEMLSIKSPLDSL